MMNTNNDVALERLSRIVQYQKITEPGFIPSSDDVLEVDNLKIPFSELSLIHDGCEEDLFEKECKWFYFHECSDTVYILMARYEWGTDLTDIQVRTMKMAGGAAGRPTVVETTLEFLKHPKGPTVGEKCGRAEGLMKNYMEALEGHGYPPEHISYTLSPKWGGCVKLKFLHRETLDNPQATAFIKASIASSFNKEYAGDGKRQFLEYWLQLDSLEELLTDRAALETKPSTLIEDVLSYLENGYWSDFIHMDIPPRLRFQVEDGILHIKIVFPDGSEEGFGSNKNCMYSIITKEDREMADYLLSLNGIGVGTEDGGVIVINIIAYVGLEKFNLPFDEHMREAQIKWLSDPRNSRWLRKDKIQRFLDSLV